MEVTIKCSQEETKAAINSLWIELEDVLVCVDQRMQGLCEVLNEKIDETQMDLRVSRTI
jgi:hypothetical protein